MQDRKVDFIIIGAAKSGTTTLHGYLSKHPDVFMPELKEPCYFDDTMKDGIEPSKGWHLGEDWYHGLFTDADDGQLLGEASTNYTRYPQVTNTAKRIFDYNPQIKLIYILRDPVARTYSHFVHRCIKELKLNPPFAGDFREHLRRDPMCLDSSMYAMQLDQYYEYFEPDSILLLSFSQLKKSPEQVVSKVLDFLGLDDAPSIFEGEVDLNSADRFASIKQRHVIKDRYMSNPFIRAFSKLVSNPRLRQFLFRTLAKLPVNKRLSEQVNPPGLTSEEEIYLKDRLQGDREKLRDVYGFDDQDW